MPWSDPTVETFRADLVALLNRYQGLISPLTIVLATNDIIARYIIPGAPLPEPTPPPPEAPETRPAA
jgi:hypothetical protein